MLGQSCICSFAVCTFLFAGAAALGYTMFGESTMSQFTLNMPQNLVASKIAVWTTVMLTHSTFLLIYLTGNLKNWALFAAYLRDGKSMDKIYIGDRKYKYIIGS